VIEVLEPGGLTTVQDLGRAGYASLGVPHSGAADVPALRLANRLVGNPENAAALEVTLGGLVVRVTRAITLALTGAPCPATAGSHAVAMLAPVSVPAGTVLGLGLPAAGLRTYVAIRGGITVPATLGSRSTDVLSGLGPPVLAAGDRLPVGGEPVGDITVDVAPVEPIPTRTSLGVLIGPRTDWFSPDALASLCREPYVVSTESDRVGVRLTGRAIERVRAEELPSEGLVTGAVQIPPDGQPVVFLTDHPVTGGYPVLGVVVAADLPVVAQVRPGDAVRFVSV
jgi:biotin-dependent carboxylase-like uncharacterized protein